MPHQRGVDRNLRISEQNGRARRDVAVSLVTRLSSNAAASLCPTRSFGMMWGLSGSTPHRDQLRVRVTRALYATCDSEASESARG